MNTDYGPDDGPNVDRGVEPDDASESPVQNPVAARPSIFPLPDDKGYEILRVEVGSTLHGTGLDGHEDLDMMGVFVEWPRTTIGLGQVEHYVRRTAADGERSQNGDVDLVSYSLRKWARLTTNGNPSTLLPLFVPEDKIIHCTGLGKELRENAHWFASRRSGRAFLGYMEQQRQRMTGQRGKAGRVRVMSDGGVDWKYAMHMLRLGYQGREFLETGRLTLPIPSHPGDLLREVRQGLLPFDQVIDIANRLESEVKMLLDGTQPSPLPEQPDVEAIERFVVQAHLVAWVARRATADYGVEV